MKPGAPKLIAIDHDDYHAEHVGKTKDGRQFFLTTPFVPSKREFIALFLFDKKGALVSATIDDLGTRSKLDHAKREAFRDQLLASLGKVKHCRIKIAPFKVKRFGVAFGLIPRAPEEEGDDWCVTLEPGDYMCFWPPWTSGEYDT
jgi:hypothetical protein